MAERRLRREGYRILERNFRGRTGEIDFVAEEKGVLCFVEVKGRSGRGFGEPEEAVTLEKQRRIFRVAEEYLVRRGGPESACRFDVVAIVAGDDGARMTVIRDAFRGPLPPRRPPAC
jgi:putative endonuclease